MLKKLLLLLSLTFCLFLFKIPAFADDKFEITNSSIYTISEDGTTTLTQKTTIKNKTEFYYTPSYTINLGLHDLKNVRVTSSEGSIPFVINNTEEGKNIEITFPKRVVGRDRVNEFSFTFDTTELTKKTGSTWEVDIPGLANPENFDSYTIELRVPDSFGKPWVIKPHTSSQGARGVYKFSLDDVGKSGIFMIFGDTQYYRANLTYHIGNSNLFPIKTEIALPPSTNYQEVVLENLNPPPQNVYQDLDGNWLAIYNLSSNQKLTIHGEFIIRGQASPDPSPASSLEHYTRPLEFWEAGSAEVKKAAENLATPYDIYQYVVDKLSYNFDKVSGSNNRLGAQGALKKPDYAVCLEFTDLFVALARAKGIPARAVEGYAYTGNSKLRPLSLLKDVLHSWPEYYDKNKQSWIMVDPTWGNTTSGMDYFNSFDFDHIAFVIKGISSTYPVPAGGYKFSSDSKDVHVSFATKGEFRPSPNSQLEADFPSFSLSGMSTKGFITLKNTGNVVLKDAEVQIDSTLSPSSSRYYVGSIPPRGEKTVTIAFEKTPLFSGNFLTNKTHTVTILFNGSRVTKKIEIGLVPKNYYLLLGGGILSGAALIIIITIKTRGLHILRQKK